MIKIQGYQQIMTLIRHPLKSLINDLINKEVKAANHEC